MEAPAEEVKKLVSEQRLVPLHPSTLHEAPGHA